jgi:hypothetical protein
MTHRLRLLSRAIIPVLAVSAIVGCKGAAGGGKDGVITAPPSNWQSYAKQTVTLEGSAGNSPSGPILRFKDGSFIGVQGLRMWSLDVVGRPIGVTGTIAQGQGTRSGEWVLEAKEFYLQQKTAVPKKPA